MLMAEMPESIQEDSGRNLRRDCDGVSSTVTTRENNCIDNERLMEAVVERENMAATYKRVVGNRGSAGIDNMTVDELKPYLNAEWERIKSELLEDRYIPKAVLKVEIPKDEGVRMLGIPTVVDRLIGQALYRVMKPIFEPGFSERSYGFIEGHSAQQAVKQSRAHIEQGYDWVVDIDLEKFFDRVNHDVLMARIAKKIKDKRVLRLLRRYLQAGIMIDGIVSPRQEGTPQGSPLSPLLSNILLDDLDKELEKRGHKFVRYADDCNIYVKSNNAAWRVMDSVTRFLSKKLRLKVNKEKSRIDRPWKLKYLGYSVTAGKEKKLKPAPQSISRLKSSLNEIFREGRGRSQERIIEELNKKLRGWANYFRLAEVKLIFEELDSWIRRKIRCILWRQWKRVYCRAKNLMNCGLNEKQAWKSATNGRGPWWNAGASHMNLALPKFHFDQYGLVSLYDRIVVRS
jgi:RNA-directed DNA polymerase